MQNISAKHSSKLDVVHSICCIFAQQKREQTIPQVRGENNLIIKKWKETKISKDYHISWIPTSYLIDPDGKVYFSTVKAEEMMQKLDSLDKEGKLTVNTIKK